MKTVFLRALEADDKAAALRTAIREPAAALGRQRFEVDPASFVSVPRSPFGYWVSARMRALFRDELSLEAEGRTAKRGPSTSDDFRYVRCWWAVQLTSAHGHGAWKYFAKGGKFSPFYADVYLVVDWEPRRRTFLGFFGRPGRETERPESLGFFFRPGLTWPLRTQGGLSLRAMPTGCIFGHKGPAAFVKNDDSEDLLALLAITNARAFRALVDLQMAFGSYEVGVIQRTPIPRVSPADQSVLATLARQAWSRKRSLDTCIESSHAFVLPALLLVDGDTLAARANAWAEHVRAIEARLSAIQAEIDIRCFDLYGIEDDDRRAISEGFGHSTDESDEPDDTDAEADADDDGEAESSGDAASLAAELISWAVGVAFGRFDTRLANGARPPPPEPEPFDPLPVCSPAMLTGVGGLPITSMPPGYPIDFPANGILADDPGHARDLAAAVRRVFDEVFNASADAWWNEVVGLLDPKDHDLRAWLAASFLDHHLKRHSKSRRKAPILWQLGVPSDRYSVWLYAHRLTRDSFFQIQNDVVTPKLAYEERQLTSLMQSAGANPSAKARKEIAAQESLVEELRALLDEVKRVAPLWNPTLDDGVVLTMAPLWRLVPQHKPWQKELKGKWDELATGKYAWAHVAMHLWPERVVPKCATDRSLAIAHDLEDVFWVEDLSARWRQRVSVGETVGYLTKTLFSDRLRQTVEELVTFSQAHPAPTGCAPSWWAALSTGAHEGQKHHLRGDFNRAIEFYTK
jgi:hypothetical protein